MNFAKSGGAAREYSSSEHRRKGVDSASPAEFERAIDYVLAHKLERAAVMGRRAIDAAVFAALNRPTKLLAIAVSTNK